MRLHVGIHVLGNAFFLLRNKPVPAFACYGLACALKLQSVFLLPVLLYANFSTRSIYVLCFLEVSLVVAITSIPHSSRGRLYKEQHRFIWSRRTRGIISTITFVGLKQPLRVKQAESHLYTLHGIGPQGGPEDHLLRRYANRGEDLLATWLRRAAYYRITPMVKVEKKVRRKPADVIT